ncbi:hypothetical protein DIS09_09545 [Burkholderia pseudomallei]|nr:hypothetical protein BOC35_05545 [Burkholderia pseudomallei]ARK55838.1 hypothetical protein BOC36_22080 [Burkholderia pseudomallei]ARK59184.1 hypothetical protein BOC37_03745 [Burkholderia pseudomallei]ARK70704.1 hypothetical protein BOC38_29655 [Burkholderia pseudomallei]ARK73942.1 hypothetical protein BOC39_10055 [Burkholderia pseudomallei]
MTPPRAWRHAAATDGQQRPRVATSGPPRLARAVGQAHRSIDVEPYLCAPRERLYNRRRYRRTR